MELWTSIKWPYQWISGRGPPCTRSQRSSGPESPNTTLGWHHHPFRSERTWYCRKTDRVFFFKHLKTKWCSFFFFLRKNIRKEHVTSETTCSSSPPAWGFSSSEGDHAVVQQASATPEHPGTGRNVFFFAVKQGLVDHVFFLPLVFFAVAVFFWNGDSLANFQGALFFFCEILKKTVRFTYV